MLRSTLAASLLLLGTTLLAKPPITVDVGVDNTNPGLVVTSFSGPAQMGTLLKSTLKRCDWFNLDTPAAKATYRLSAVYQSSPPRLQIRVAGKSGGGFSLVQPGMAGEQPEAVVYRAVDSIIKQIFKVPGPCAAPIAFAMGSSNQLKEVFTCRFDGTNLQRLTHNNSISTEPSWGPHDQTLVYTTYSRHATSVILVDMQRKRQRRLSRFRGLNSGADLSPDGKFAVLCLSQDERVDLHLLHVDTGKTRRLTQDMAVESSPCWSPDGRQICYVSDRAGKPRLYLMSSGGGAARPVMSSRVETVSPDWSPVSNKICFSRRTGGQYSVGVIDMKTKEVTILTRAAGDWESPSWAPDGRHIVCSRRLGAVQSLYMIDSLQGTMVPITRGPAHSLPCWGNP